MAKVAIDGLAVADKNVDAIDLRGSTGGVAFSAGIDNQNGQIDVTGSYAEGLVRAAAGLKFETYPIWHRASNTTLVSGTVNGVMVGLRAGEIITSMVTMVQTAATSATLVKFGIYDTAGNQLAVTADASATFNSGTGQKTVDLTSPFKVSTTGVYYAVVLAVGGTPPQLYRADANANWSSWNGALHRSVAEAAQTDLDATCTFSVSALPIWIGGV